MRKLSMHDAFSVAKLMKKAGMKDEIVRISKMASDLNGTMIADELQKKVGIEAITAVIFSCAEEGVDKEFYNILADLTGKDSHDIEYLPIDEMIAIFKQIAEENNLTNFFELAVNSMK